MRPEYTLTYGKYDFIFVLEEQKIIAVEEEISPNPGYPYIYCKLYRSDLESFYWDWKGYLLPNEKIEFQLIYDDNVNIKGYICIFHSFETGENFVFMDAHFGIEYVEHFEGNILEINNTPFPPDPPAPGPFPPPSPVPPDELIGPAGFRDLFPYLYMQFWPALQGDDQIFMVPVPTDLSTSTFYTNLQNLYKGADARVNMENEALNYINGLKGYVGCFIQSIDDLAFPLNIFPEVYNEIYAETLWEEEEIMIRLTTKKHEEEAELYVPTTYPEQIKRVWENVIALKIIEGYEPFKLDQLIKILLVGNIVDFLASPPLEKPVDWLKKLIHASLVLPDTIFPLPSFGPASPPPVELYTGTVVPYAIGDLQMVQHKLNGYEPGDIAHIENVLCGEIKKTTNRKKEMVKDSVLNTHSNNQTNKKDDYGDMFEKQVYKTIADSCSDIDNYNALTVSYGPPTTGTYGGSVTNTNYRNKLAQSPVEFAKKILTKTLSKLDEKISERREHIIKNESEESVVHTIDNRNGKGNIRGIYYWLNRIYEMKLVNYGHRFMLEFIIQKPGIGITDQVKGPFIFPPIPPSMLSTPIVFAKNITKDNYEALGQQYGIYNLPSPPAPNKVVTGKLSGEEYRLSTDLMVPNGYLPKTLSASCYLPTASPPITGTLIAGEVQATINSATTPVLINDPLQLFISPPVQIAAENIVLPVLLEIPTPVINFTVPITSSPPASPPVPALTCPTLPTVYMSLTLLCSCSDELINKWKQEVFMMIQNGYETCVKKYQSEIRNQARTNPKVINQFIQKMVIGSCKEILWEQHLNINGSPASTLSPPEDSVNKFAYNQFFNEAFEWGKMIYTVENYTSTNLKEDLAEHLDDTLYDDKLEKFLSSDQVKVIVPVDQMFHYRMLYYLTSGLISYGEDHLTPVFYADEALAVKLKKVFEMTGPVEFLEIEKWKMAVPTEMQWLAESNQLPIIH